MEPIILCRFPTIHISAKTNMNGMYVLYALKHAHCTMPLNIIQRVVLLTFIREI